MKLRWRGAWWGSHWLRLRLWPLVRCFAHAFMLCPTFVVAPPPAPPAKPCLRIAPSNIQYSNQPLLYNFPDKL
jgi:hypothetical protein